MNNNWPSVTFPPNEGSSSVFLRVEDVDSWPSRAPPWPQQMFAYGPLRRAGQCLTLNLSVKVKGLAMSGDRPLVRVREHRDAHGR